MSPSRRISGPVEGVTERRKQWLREYREGSSLDHNRDVLTCAEFVDQELILFSMADNVRSIPSVIDGLKPGQRKVLFACFKRKLSQQVKVAQLAGYISEHAEYHHGEQALCSTIVNMAQDFVGSNNANLLVPHGMFGTRLHGGKDAASPRYVFTTLSKVAHATFQADDAPLATYLMEDGHLIEPKYYCPVVPLVLINGASGIGTGWSTDVPCYNPVDVVRNLRELMDGQEQSLMAPWYRGFDGVIEQRIKKTNPWVSVGNYEEVDENTLDITELPLGTWTAKFKDATGVRDGHWAQSRHQKVRFEGTKDHGADSKGDARVPYGY